MVPVGAGHEPLRAAAFGRTLGRVQRTILLICGSLGGQSANRSALDVVAAGLDALGDITVDRIDGLGEIPLLDPAEQDPPPAPVADLLARIAGADAVVVAAPEYAGALG